MKQLEKQTIEAIIGYEFANAQTLVTAFTHASYAKERGVDSNRRFEFLGDSVLNFLSARAVFLQHADADEGRMTRLRQSFVSKEPLATAIRKLGLLQFLRIGKGESLASFNDKSISDLYEAIVGAMYYDSGELIPCEVFFHRTVYASTKEAVDAISDMKEWSEKHPEVDVRTSIEKCQNGFQFGIYMLGRVFLGEGRSKKDAEREACRKACSFVHANT